MRRRQHHTVRHVAVVVMHCTPTPGLREWVHVESGVEAAVLSAPGAEAHPILDQMASGPYNDKKFESDLEHGKKRLIRLKERYMKRWVQREGEASCRLGRGASR